MGGGRCPCTPGNANLPEGIVGSDGLYLDTAGRVTGSLLSVYNVDVGGGGRQSRCRRRR